MVLLEALILCFPYYLLLCLWSNHLVFSVAYIIELQSRSSLTSRLNENASNIFHFLRHHFGMCLLTCAYISFSQSVLKNVTIVFYLIEMYLTKHVNIYSRAKMYNFESMQMQYNTFTMEHVNIYPNFGIYLLMDHWGLVLKNRLFLIFEYSRKLPFPLFTLLFLFSGVIYLGT